MKVIHVITDLGQGGAEASLYRLIVASRDRAEHVVVSLMEPGYYGPRLRALGIPVHALGFPRGKVTVRGLRALLRLLNDERPDIVQTWMYHANLVGGIAARLAGVRSVLWGIHHANLDPGSNRRSTLLVAKACAWLSRWVPDLIVVCAERSAKAHIAIGYRADLMRVIPNGYDLALFAPDARSRARLRATWGVRDDETLLGMVARWDPQKDHANLLAALAAIRVEGRSMRCVLVGSGTGSDNDQLVRLVHEHQLDAQVILAGPRDDVPAVMNALDIHVLSSLGEAFPNVVAEAMACATPCVVTDVGDAAVVVADTGWVVPPGDPVALAAGMQRAITAVLERGKDVLGGRARRRIGERFSLERMADSYMTAWQQARKRS
jgi:glycosyltransferase involved in cell wall biosynthesis